MTCDRCGTDGELSTVVGVEVREKRGEWRAQAVCSRCFGPRDRAITSNTASAVAVGSAPMVQVPLFEWAVGDASSYNPDVAKVSTTVEIEALRIAREGLTTWYGLGAADFIRQIEETDLDALEKRWKQTKEKNEVGREVTKKLAKALQTAVARLQKLRSDGRGLLIFKDDPLDLRQAKKAVRLLAKGLASVIGDGDELFGEPNRNWFLREPRITVVAVTESERTIEALVKAKKITTRQVAYMTLLAGYRPLTHRSKLPGGRRAMRAEERSSRRQSAEGLIQNEINDVIKAIKERRRPRPKSMIERELERWFLRTTNRKPHA